MRSIGKRVALPFPSHPFFPPFPSPPFLHSSHSEVVEVCSIADECFAIPSGYRQLRSGGRGTVDQEEELLQMAIQQSLMQQQSPSLSGREIEGEKGEVSRREIEGEKGEVSGREIEGEKGER